MCTAAASPHSRVLVIRAGALGDTLMITPLLRHLHRAATGREIDVLCSNSGAAILDGNPHIAAIYTLRLRNLPYAFSPEKRALARTLRERNYASAIVLESAKRYRDIAERAGIPGIRGFVETP